MTTGRLSPARYAHGVVPILTVAARVLAGGVLAWGIGVAMVAPEMPIAARAAALGVFGAALWRPPLALVAVVALVPGATLLAPAPASAAELVAWAFLSGWLLAVWRRLSPAGGLPRGVTALLVLYAGCAMASWLTLTLGGAAGVAPASLAGYLVRSIPGDHLVYSSPHPETWTLLHTLGGLALFGAAVAVGAGHPRVRTHVAVAFVTVSVLLAGVTIADIARQWAGEQFGWWFIARYFVEAERFSLHLEDLNAAGSQYVLAALLAAAFWFGRHLRRAMWLAAEVLILPALWLSGSLSAYAAVVLAGALTILGVGPRLVRLSRRQVGGAAVVLALVAAIVGFSVWQRADKPGSADVSIRVRTLFLETSTRMIASAPLTGVGIGQYLPRSPEFMPAQLRAIYPAENAHNYYAQQVAELGVLGGLLFLGLVAAGVRRGWLGARTGDLPATALLAGTGGYLLTCLTGHPLLVPEAAFPFWVAFGVLAATPGAVEARRPVAWLTPATATVATLVLVWAGSGIVPYARGSSVVVERGFHGQEVSSDGVPFRWSTRHAVARVGPSVGFLVIPLRAPDLPHRQRPFIVEVDVDGRPAARVEVPTDRWEALSIPLRRRASGPARRVDVRVNQWWTPMRDGGDPEDTRPMGVMVGDIRVERVGG